MIVASHPSTSTWVHPYCSDTCLDVGTTTMKFGVTRHGPSAPDACQFGKYDVFTSTGTPTRETSNDTPSSDVVTSDTRTLGSGRERVGDATATPDPTGPSSRAGMSASTRGHDAGPDDASGTAHRGGSPNHDAETSSQSSAACEMFDTTAGARRNGSTSDESATSYTCHFPPAVVAMSVRSGFDVACAFAASENAR